MIDEEIEQSCHELLLRLAGRLPDQLLWRYRDWLGEGATAALAKTLPRSLLKHKIDLDEREHGLLVNGLVPQGADWHQVSSVLGLDEGTENRYTFTSDLPEGVDAIDSVPMVLNATLRGRPDVGEVRVSWRNGGEPGGGKAKRVLLVTAQSGLSRLTGELQRVLRALGEDEPSVEVLPRGIDLPEYHNAAIANSELVCVGAAEVGDPLVPA